MTQLNYSKTKFNTDVDWDHMNNKTAKDTVIYDEQRDIDLIDVMLQLWRGKIIVVFFAIVSLILGVLYLKSVPEKWTSATLVTQPSAEQISGYIDVLNLIYEREAPTIADSQQLFFGFFKSSLLALSDDNSKTGGSTIFLETLIADKTLPQGSLAPLDPSLPFKITYKSKGMSAKQTQQVLIKLIQKANHSAVTQVKNSLSVALNSRVRLLNNDLLKQEKNAIDEKSLRIDDIEQALKLSSQLNIKTSKNSSAELSSGNLMFMLGSENLDALLQYEKNKPLSFSNHYYSLLNEIKILNSIDIEQLNFDSYTYLTKPSLSSFQDGPGKSLILTLATLFGVMVGAGFVFARDTFKVYLQQGRFKGL